MPRGTSVGMQSYKTPDSIRDRIRIGKEYFRWESLRNTIGADKNENVAKLLLDAWYDRGSLLCSKCGFSVNQTDSTVEEVGNSYHTNKKDDSQCASKNTNSLDEESGEDEFDDDDDDSDNEDDSFHVDQSTSLTDEARGHQNIDVQALQLEKNTSRTSDASLKTAEEMNIPTPQSSSTEKNASVDVMTENSAQRSDALSPAVENFSSTSLKIISVVSEATDTCDQGYDATDEHNVLDQPSSSGINKSGHGIGQNSKNYHTSVHNYQKPRNKSVAMTPEKIAAIKTEPVSMGYDEVVDEVVDETGNENAIDQDTCDTRSQPMKNRTVYGAVHAVPRKEGMFLLPIGPNIYPLENSLVRNSAATVTNQDNLSKSRCDAGVQWEDSGTQTEYSMSSSPAVVTRLRGRPRKQKTTAKITSIPEKKDQAIKTTIFIAYPRGAHEINQGTFPVQPQKIPGRKGKKKKAPVKNRNPRPRQKPSDEPDWEWDVDQIDDISDENDEEETTSKKRKKRDDDPDFTLEGDKKEAEDDEDALDDDAEEDKDGEMLGRKFVGRKKLSDSSGRLKNGRFCKTRTSKSKLKQKAEKDGTKPKRIYRKRKKDVPTDVLTEVPKRKYKKRIEGQPPIAKKKYEDIAVRLEEHQDKFEMTTYTSQAKSDRSLDVSLKSYSRYTCKLCNGMYNTKDKFYMEDHIKLHLQGRLSCEECQITFSTIQNQRDHNARLHKMREFICEMCAQSFCSIKTLNHHLSMVHNEKPFKCQYCSERYSSNRSMRAHMFEAHPGSVVKCETCGDIFLTKKTLGFHQASVNCLSRAKMVPEKVPCEQCGKFVIRTRMNTHIQRAHLKIHTFKCDKCPYTANTSCRIKFHMMTHTGEHPYRCEQCTFSCIKPSQLKCHMRTHTGDKPYKCDQCSYASAWNVQLKGHKKAHDSPVKVDCTICNVTFKDDRGLSLHNKKEHSSSEDNPFRPVAVRQQMPGLNNFYKKDKTNSASVESGAMLLGQQRQDIPNKKDGNQEDEVYRPRPAHFNQKRDDMRTMELSDLEIAAGYLYRPFMNL